MSGGQRENYRLRTAGARVISRDRLIRLKSRGKETRNRIKPVVALFDESAAISG